MFSYFDRARAVVSFALSMRLMSLPPKIVSRRSRAPTAVRAFWSLGPAVLGASEVQLEFTGAAGCSVFSLLGACGGII